MAKAKTETLPGLVRVVRHYSWYEESGNYMQYQAGQIVSDPEEIAKLMPHLVTEDITPEDTEPVAPVEPVMVAQEETNVPG